MMDDGTTRAERIAEALVEAEEIRGRSLWQDARQRFFANKAAVGALICLLAVVAFTVIGPSPDVRLPTLTAPLSLSTVALGLVGGRSTGVTFASRLISPALVLPGWLMARA